MGTHRGMNMSTPMICPKCGRDVEVKPHNVYGDTYWFCHACRLAEIYPGPEVRAQLARLRRELEHATYQLACFRWWRWSADESPPSAESVAEVRAEIAEAAAVGGEPQP